MKEAFEKIIERLEEQQEEYVKDYDRYGDGEDYRISLIYERAIKIVNQVAEEYVPDINVGNNDGWIPCSVGLPKAHIEVWITYKWDDGSIHVGRDRVIHGEWYCTKREAVIAWKYIKAPAPYAPNGE